MDIIILNSSTSLGIRIIGAHRTATELRKNGFTVKVIDFVEYLTEMGIDDLIFFLKKYMTSETLWVGLSSTWFWKVRQAKNLEKEHSANIPQIPTPMLDVDYSEANTIKELILSISPKCKIVCGGTRANNLQFKNFFDVYILGYSEIHAVDLRFQKRRELYWNVLRNE